MKPFPYQHGLTLEGSGVFLLLRAKPLSTPSSAASERSIYEHGLAWVVGGSDCLVPLSDEPLGPFIDSTGWAENDSTPLCSKSVADLVGRRLNVWRQRQ